MNFAKKYVVGTGAAVNVALGFIPDWVRIANITDDDIIHEGPLERVLAFDTGGASSGGRELRGGQRIQGSTADKPTALIRDVAVHTGTWTAGTAAGFIILDLDEKPGTFTNNEDLKVATQVGNRLIGEHTFSEETYAIMSADGPSSVAFEIGGTTAKGAATDTIAAYYGTAGSASKGITFGSTISEDNKLLVVQAWRESVG